LATNLYKKVASWPAARLICAKAISAARPFCSQVVFFTIRSRICGGSPVPSYSLPTCPDTRSFSVEVCRNVPWEPTQDVGILADVARLEVEHEADGVGGARARSLCIRCERPEPDRVEREALSPQPRHAVGRGGADQAEQQSSLCHCACRLRGAGGGRRVR